MLSSYRHKRILESLAVSGQLEVSALATELGCSEKTIRRDLEQLESAGRLQRVHGGAIATDDNGIVPIEQRFDRERRAKQTIAGLAIDRIPEGAMVFLGGGSTTLAIAGRLAGRPPVTVATNMIDIAQVLDRDGRHRVFLTGGELIAATHTLRGAETLQFIDARLFDLVISGATGIDPDHGVMGPTDWHLTCTALLLRRTRRFMVVAASSKVGQRDRYRLCELSDIDTLVTDRRPEQPFLDRLIAQEVEVLHP